eukprot:Rhum_TRINITY_DN12462_c1_g1::Rhum_TRINITY_DN12462_c1_g1_i1::g.52057::m.52057
MGGRREAWGQQGGRCGGRGRGRRRCRRRCGWVGGGRKGLGWRGCGHRRRRRGRLCTTAVSDRLLLLLVGRRRDLRPALRAALDPRHEILRLADAAAPSAVRPPLIVLGSHGAHTALDSTDAGCELHAALARETLPVRHLPQRQLHRLLPPAQVPRLLRRRHRRPVHLQYPPPDVPPRTPTRRRRRRRKRNENQLEGADAEPEGAVAPDPLHLQRHLPATATTATPAASAHDAAAAAAAAAAAGAEVSVLFVDQRPQGRQLAVHLCLRASLVRLPLRHQPVPRTHTPPCDVPVLCPHLDARRRRRRRRRRRLRNLQRIAARRVRAEKHLFEVRHRTERAAHDNAAFPTVCRGRRSGPQVGDGDGRVVLPLPRRAVGRVPVAVDHHGLAAAPRVRHFDAGREACARVEEGLAGQRLMVHGVRRVRGGHPALSRRDAGSKCLLQQRRVAGVVRGVEERHARHRCRGGGGRCRYRCSTPARMSNHGATVPPLPF